MNAPPFFENIRALIAKTVADQNTIFLPWGDGDAVIPLVAAEDCARVAAALLIAPDAPDQKRYDLVGETPTVNEIATILSAVLDRPIHYVDIPMNAGYKLSKIASIATRSGISPAYGAFSEPPESGRVRVASE